MLVLPSLDEGFGIPVLEAMTVGVPVIVSNRGSLPEIVGEAGVIVDPEDTHALAAAMANLLDDHERYARLVKAGVAQATRFRWGRSAAALLGAYHDAYRRRRGEAPDADRS
jgi:glycosyltransferase involved in cell wall biosynthesis